MVWVKYFLNLLKGYDEVISIQGTLPSYGK
jgi:hypothetical protein